MREGAGSGKAEDPAVGIGVPETWATTSLRHHHRLLWSPSSHPNSSSACRQYHHEAMKVGVAAEGLI
ncbi:hypothetical protein BS78_03G173600 [Paspalum vaginatum]|nr:hypothetical protein BS78_03G173600 [Paspalum vaginatum]KAJ1284047.1 hypothetical protein BS78_03G173600 [Paspalum vaginatum]